jgi:hypothetical protein
MADQHLALGAAVGRAERRLQTARQPHVAFPAAHPATIAPGWRGSATLPR